jgi:cob(I)alamin adenosyltransferase
MKLYTKIGDGGKTTFFGCGLVDKNDPRIEAFGALDELNSVIGVSLCFIEDTKLRDIMTKIQNDLFQVGADLVGSKLAENSVPRIREEHVTEMEKHIDELDKKLGIPNKFILPGGTPASAFLHLCRATTRRAERTLVGVQSVIQINGAILRYVNRLSDFLYILARDANNEIGMKEQQVMYKYTKE